MLVDCWRIAGWLVDLPSSLFYHLTLTHTTFFSSEYFCKICSPIKEKNQVYVSFIGYIIMAQKYVGSLFFTKELKNSNGLCHFLPRPMLTGILKKNPPSSWFVCARYFMGWTEEMGCCPALIEPINYLLNVHFRNIARLQNCHNIRIFNSPLVMFMVMVDDYWSWS